MKKNIQTNFRAIRVADILSAPKASVIAATVAVSLLIAACGGGGNDALDTASTAAAASRKTVAAAATSASVFYGANGHNNEGGAYDISSPALQLSQLQDLGVKLYRNEVYSQGSANKLAGIAKTMAAGGVTVYPVMLMSIDFSSETDAYNAGYQLGVWTATAYKYPYYEVSNELDTLTIYNNVDGVYPQQFDNAKFQIARGVIRGMIAGVKSVDTNGKIVMGGGTWMHYALDQMLANGTQPDGTTGHPVVNWDITAWHWYSDMGDITNACGGTGCHDVLATLQQMGKPIWINEFGVRPWMGTDQQIAAYLVGNKMMSEFVAVASKYNIQAIQTYELYDDPNGGEGAYGLLKNDGKTQKAAYTAFKNFVASNPK
ncbi:lipopolysaccharide biosynthesis protein [Caballeronia sp. J97]|uniref:lipopolysaccharide biosynthesis protein n=1 Tax=Caballeronia sp. J97 TaxID=2805429 RepID=UPI002AB20546|nr:lipopolysaccharide biosynthesis protein [Caballeronia sp. J97]